MLPLNMANSFKSAILRTATSILKSPTEQLSWQLGMQLRSTLLPASSSVLFDQKRFASKHGGLRYFRKDYNIMRERPVGPHKPLAPFVKYDGRIGEYKNYRYIVHYPEDGKYTIKKLPMTKLGGRDPVTKFKVIQGVRGGAKRLFRWIDWRRVPVDWDPNGPDLVERIIKVAYDPNRKPMIILSSYEDKMRWQIATDKMKVGDLIRTSTKIPPVPIKPKEGDCHPLGALPIGTAVCLVQWYPDSSVVKIYNEREFARIIRKVGDRVIIERDDSKLQFSLDQKCQAVVGKVSIHPLKALPIGSPNRARWMGIGPRSGLWHRKTGIHGRKVRKLPPAEEVNLPEPSTDINLLLHSDTEGLRGALPLRKHKINPDKW